MLNKCVRAYVRACVVRACILAELPGIARGEQASNASAHDYLHTFLNV